MLSGGLGLPNVIPMSIQEAIAINPAIGSKGQYDFKLTIKGETNFIKHYAGHVETGEDSIIDPFMGGIFIMKPKSITK